MTGMTSSYNDLPVLPWKPGIPTTCGCGVSAVDYGYVMAEQEGPVGHRALRRPGPAQLPGQRPEPGLP